MPDADDPSNPRELVVGVELGRALDRFLPPNGKESALLTQLLKLFLDDLLSDLAVPRASKIDVSTDSLGPPLAPGAVRVMVHDRRVRTGPNLDCTGMADGSSLALWIAGLFVAEPEMLVNNVIANEIARDWTADGVPWFEREMPPADFRRVLHLLISRGFRITRAREWARNQPPKLGSSVEPTHVADAITAPLESCSLAIQLAGNLYDDALERTSGPDGAAEGKRKSFDELMSLLRDGLFYEFGVCLPKVTLEREFTMAGNIYRCRLNDRRLLPQMGLQHDQMMVGATVETLDDLGISAQASTNPANGTVTALVRGAEYLLTMIEARGHTVWDNLGHVVLALAGEVRKRIGDFHTAGASEVMFGSLAQAFPGLVAAAKARFGNDKLAAVFRCLADEGISIRDYRGLLEGLLALRRSVVLDPRTADVLLDDGDVCVVTSVREVDDLGIDDLVGQCRRVFRRNISHKFAKSGVLNVFVLDPRLEERLRNLDSMPLTEDDSDALIRGISRALAGLSRDTNPVILAAFDVRAVLRATIRSYYPDFAVLARQELVPEVQLNMLGRISWEPS